MNNNKFIDGVVKSVWDNIAKKDYFGTFKDGNYLFQIAFNNGLTLNCEMQIAGQNTNKVFRGIEVVLDGVDPFLLKNAGTNVNLKDLEEEINRGFENIKEVAILDIDDLNFAVHQKKKIKP